MFADPNNSFGSVLLSSVVTAVPALGAVGVAIWSNIKTNRNALAIQDIKGAIDRNLEELKAQLAHGKLISSTQWNAEFNAYQALWKSIVPVRSLAHKIVMREGELPLLGLETGDVSEETKIANIKRLLTEYTQASNLCVLAINEHAPFYAADIRREANDVHGLAHVVLQTNLAALVARMKAEALPLGQSASAAEKSRKELKALMEGVDRVEDMIRDRMNGVRVFNSFTV